MPARQKIRVAIIEWDDAIAGSGWTSDHTGEAPSHCISIGAIVAEDKASITLAGTWGQDGDDALQSNNRMTIPKGMISKRRFVRV